MLGALGCICVRGLPVCVVKRAGKMKYNRGTALRVFCALLVLALSQGALATTYYTYDILGRVTQVVESDGTTTQYSYDANGNVTSINRTAGTSVLSIGSVSTSSGASGSSVTITGSGFSSIPSQDVVTFNGVAATVTYASGNRLVVTVPAGATTGDISITTQAGSVTSESSFTVVPVSITSISPSSGVVGSVLTVNGGGFDPTLANNTVLINGVPAAVTSATATQLQVTVPSGATPGHISVNAPLGSALSAGYFFVPASGYTLSQITQVAALVPGGGGQVFPINAANQVGVALFDGVAGQRMSMVATNLNAATDYTVFAPDGSTLASNISYPNAEIALPPLPQAGTYAWYYTPNSVPASGTFQLLTDVVGGLPTDGTPTVTSLAPGQNATYTFSGTAGQFYNLTLTSFNPSAYVNAEVFNPDGSLLVNCGAYQAYYNQNQNCEFTVGTSATYTVRIVPIASGGLVPASFSTYVVQDFSATLTAGTPGPTVGITLVPEQNGRINFTATANQTLALYFGTVADNPTNDPLSVQVSGPGPISNSGVGLVNGQSTTFNLPNLGAGNYLVTIRPFNNGAAVSMPAVLANGVTGTMTTNGTPTSVQTYVPGQNAYLTFNGTQGQNLTLVLSQLELTPSSINSASISVTNPDGSSYTSGTCYTSSTPGCSFNLGSLPQTGTYTVVVNPDGQATMGVALSLPPEVTGALTLNNSTTVSLTSLGQQAALTFTVTANEALILAVSSITTTPANTPVTFYIYNSSGDLVTQDTITGEGAFNLNSLTAGTYSVVVAPDNAATGSLQITPELGTSGALTPNGSPQNFITSTPGEDAYLTFSAVAGQSLDVAISNLVSSPSSDSVVFQTYTPDGNPYASTWTCSPGALGCVLTLYGLPQTGTYTIRVTPQPSQTISFTTTTTFWLTGTLALNTPQTVNMSTIGQAAVLTFTATAGENLLLNLNGLTTSPAGDVMWFEVRDSSGNTVQSITTTSSATLNLTNLAGGTYYVMIFTVFPGASVTASAQVTLAPPVVTGALSPDGTSVNFSTSVPVQGLSLGFSAVAGQAVDVAISNLVLNPAGSNTTTFQAYTPDGKSYASTWNCSPGALGCVMTLYGLPQTGAYSIKVTPPSSQTVSFTATTSYWLPGTLTLNTPLTVNLGTVGEAAALNFTATAGQSLQLDFNGLTTSPAGYSMWVQVLDPSGNLIAGNTTSSSETLNLPNLAGGTYHVLIFTVFPGAAVTATAQVTLVP